MLSIPYTCQKSEVSHSDYSYWLLQDWSSNFHIVHSVH